MNPDDKTQSPRMIRLALPGLLLLGTAALAAPALGQSPSQFNLTGVTAYDPADLLGFAAQVEVQDGGTVTAEELAETVRLIYHNDGYFLAEVFVADDGRTLVVDEGEIAEIQIEGMDAATYERARTYLAPVVGKRAVNLREFERAVMLIEDIESISATAEVVYEPGAAHASLRVIAAQEDRSFGSLTIDTPERDPQDAVALSLEQTFLAALTPGDRLRLNLSASEALSEDGMSLWGSLAYRTPVGGSGGFVEAYLGSVTARRDASGNLQASDFEGDTALLAFGHPVLRDVETFGYGIVELRQSANSSVTGDSTFDSKVSVASASWIYGRTLNGGGAMEYAVSAALGRQDDAAARDGDDRFSYLHFGAGFETPASWLGDGGAFRAEFWGQYSADDLPSIEKFYLGGHSEDRGYAFGEADGDSGISATVEVSREFRPSGNFVQNLRPFGFLDVGYVRTNEPGPAEQASHSFAALGVGVDAAVINGVLLRSFVALPLKDGPLTESGDPSIYLSLTKNW